MFSADSHAKRGTAEVDAAMTAGVRHMTRWPIDGKNCSTSKPSNVLSPEMMVSSALRSFGMFHSSLPSS
jgi:hypothetical protein